MPLITWQALEADATVPQCLDNQYVSDALFAHLMKSGATYEDETVQKKRASEIQTEFVRSLVYSSQVVINRAFMRNNEYLYKYYQPQNVQDFAAFSTLLRRQAIIPFLFSESSLADNPAFDIRNEGDLAVKDLVQATGDDAIKCVRLAVDDETNKRLISHLSTRFADRLVALSHLDDLRRNAMAVELFGEKHTLHKQGGWTKFTAALDSLADYAHEVGKKKRSTGYLSRNDVYSRFLADKAGHKGAGTAITSGRFRKPDAKNPFVFEMKKLVDLIYNTNLPDLLHRYTLTPANLPSRTALQDHPDSEGESEQNLHKLVSDRHLMPHIRRMFMAGAHKAMFLPLLRNLTLKDVIAVRALPEWAAFKDAKSHILSIKRPEEFLNQFEKFERSFDTFQSSLSKWYNRTYKHRQTEKQYKKYLNFVTIGVGVAGTVLFAGGGVKEAALAGAAFHAGLDHLTELIPERVKGYTIKLMMGVYDQGKQDLDHDRTVSLDIMRTNDELTREDVKALINDMAVSSRGLPKQERKLVADQGK